MKKLFVTMLTILSCGAAYALPVGNPADASLLCDGLMWEGHCADPCDPCLTWCDAFSVRLGFYGDYVYNRHMEVDDHDFDANIERTVINTNAALVAANFYDRFDIFATFGASNLFIDSNSNVFVNQNGSGRFEIETETDFSWSLGVRGTIWECGCTTLGAEAQYFYTDPHITRVTNDADDTIYLAHGLDAKYYEWQIGLGLAHRINMLVPYVAIKWSQAKLDMDNAVISEEPGFASGEEWTLRDLTADKEWGYAVGVSLVDCEKVSLTVEGRFADEKALHINGQLRF